MLWGGVDVGQTFMKGVDQLHHVFVLAGCAVAALMRSLGTICKFSISNVQRSSHARSMNRQELKAQVLEMVPF